MKNYSTFSDQGMTSSPPPPDLLSIPGSESKNGRPKFSSGSEESIRLGSRVTFTDQTVSFENGEGENGSGAVRFVVEAENADREEWANKTQFYMGVVSYAVGLGNVWRFPYLLQKNGGGAFLIPYIIMMGLGGLPLFLIELGIGQRLRTGPMGVWAAIHPYLGGLGVSAAIVSYLVAMYYNVIVTWCLYYLFKSFTLELPWSECPKYSNGTEIEECAKQGEASYFWNHEALETTESISDFGGFNYHILTALGAAWLLIYLCVNKGIKSSGNVMYITAIFPYIVTFMFLIRSATLEGAMAGISHMFHPDLAKLLEPTVWLEAATQIFYSMGLGFGGLIAFGSYNPLKNDCKKDAVRLALVNIFTSIYTAVNIFCVLGYMATRQIHACIEEDKVHLHKLFPEEFPYLSNVTDRFSDEDILKMIENRWTGDFTRMTSVSKMCNFEATISKAAEGTGLAFVVFTEAILQFPIPPFWSVLFFLMLLSLGLGSMFGTLEGVITSLNDSKLVTLRKPVMTFILCLSAFLVGLPFASKSGQYWVSLFDSFAGSYALMCVAFLEIVAVSYVYKEQRFSDDIEYMTGSRPGLYWRFTWKIATPFMMLVLFIASVAQFFKNPAFYFAYDAAKGRSVQTDYPIWAMYIAVFMVLLAISPTLIILFLRYFRIWKFEANIPAASKCLNTTPSTTHMLKNEQSYNRINDSTVSVSEIDTFNATTNGNGLSANHRQ
ncbi:unnamed protein product [Caenorhabditis angaria]|uniref:Transporter n=1 Tax=Caenorhabditis angaria TaxID=860376 RepID=A0A9P1J3R0_9PELO|nr:unnamed protein product [Caenorhabditis angaria]